MTSINNYYASSINYSLAAGLAAGLMAGSGLGLAAKNISPVSAALLAGVQYLAFNVVNERVQTIAQRHFTDIKKEEVIQLAVTLGAITFCAVPYVAGLNFWTAVDLAFATTFGVKLLGVFLAQEKKPEAA